MSVSRRHRLTETVVVGIRGPRRNFVKVERPSFTGMERRGLRIRSRGQAGGKGSLYPPPGIQSGRGLVRRLVTFRIAITAAVLAFVMALAACLLAIQIATSHLAARAAAGAAMDAASANTLLRLEAEVSELDAFVRLLAAAPGLAASDKRSEDDDAIILFRAALRQLPEADSFYVGYANGCWLQLRRVDVLGPAERRKIEAPPGAVWNINLVHPTEGGALPMRRLFEGAQGNPIARLDLPHYGYDARKRDWYRDTMRSNRAVMSPPYASFSIGTPMLTLSEPLHGAVHGVIAADLKLDRFSQLVQTQRPGAHGMAVIFDSFGTLIAYPDFARLMKVASSHSAQPQLPNIGEIHDGLVGAVMRRWDGSDRLDGNLSDADGQDYLYRVRRFTGSDGFSGYFLMLAAENDFAQNVRNLQLKGIVIALIAGACFVPLVWLFGSRMAASLQRLTAQATKLRTLEAPDAAPVTSRIAEIHQLGRVMAIAQRSIASFARFVPRDIVGGIIDGSISTELGGNRQEVTILFTDVTNFTGIAEGADPDGLMRQTSRHFAALTQAFLAAGGTVDKYIGDSVMVFWNAPHPQRDHVARACGAALAAKAASEALNVQFTAEGLPPFLVRLGIHCGVAVVGNVGSTERMNYTALGNSVNLAARLEGLNKEYGTTILVSEAVRARVADRFRFNPIGSVLAKGMTTKTEVWELVEAIT
jgi:adenylate cyclase